MCGVGAGRAADGGLVNVDDLVAMFQARHLVMRASDDARAVKGASAGGVVRIDGEAGLARTRYAGDAGEGAERDAGGHVLKIVGARIVNGELLARSLAALCGQWDLPRAVQVIGGEAGSVGEHFVKRTLRHDLPAVDARAGAHVPDVLRTGRTACEEKVGQ